MARQSKVEACMFCSSLPCVCNVKPKKRPAPKPKAKLRSRASEAAKPAPIQPERCENSGMAVEACHRTDICDCHDHPELNTIRGQNILDTVQPTPERKRFRAPDKTATKPEVDFETAEAIRNLDAAGMLSETDQAKYSRVLKPLLPSDVERRLMEWRKRNVNT